YQRFYKFSFGKGSKHNVTPSK
uniref:Uncharacterized protein n=1 Tax=Papio anubis TaxID=9555 RepID=A0A8I5NFJ8_PAPAN